MADGSGGAGGDASRRMTTEEEAEVRKVWALVDTDGSSEIDASELGRLMTALNGGAAPRAEEVARVLEAVDENNDGVISWGEFRDAMGGWIGGAKKRAFEEDSSDEEGVGSPVSRKRIHKEISSFFTRFNRRSDEDLAAVSAKLAAEEVEAKELDLVDDAELELGLMPAAEKTAYLAEVREHLDDIKGLHARVHDPSDPSAVEAGVIQVVALLRTCDVFPTPAQRFEVREVLHQIFDHLVSWNVPKIPETLVQYCDPKWNRPPDHDTYLNIVENSMTALYLFALGPRVPHEHLKSPWHPEKVWEGIVCGLFTLNLDRHALAYMQAFASGSAAGNPARRAGAARLCSAAARLLCAMGAKQFDAWDRLATSGAMRVVLDVINRCLVLESGDSSVTEITMPVMRSATMLMAILCGHTHAEAVSAEMFEVLDGTAVLDCASQLLNSVEFARLDTDGLAVCNHITLALSQFLPAVAESDVLTPRMLDLVDNLTKDEVLRGGDSVTNELRMRAAVGSLTCLRRLMVSDPEFAAKVVSSTVLVDVLKRSLSDGAEAKRQVRLAACQIVSALVGPALGMHRSLLEVDGMLSAITNTMHSDEILRLRVVKILRSLAKASGVRLVDFERFTTGDVVVKALFSVLRHFRKRDAVLADVYVFVGPTYQFDLVVATMETLHEILTSGARMRGSDEEGAKNTALSGFNVEQIDHFRTFLGVIASERKDSPYLAAAEHASDNVRLYDGAEALVMAMGEEHQAAAEAGNATSASLVDELTGILTELQRNKSSWTTSLGSSFKPAAYGQVHVRVLWEPDDRRDFNAPKDMSHLQLTDHVTGLYGRQMRLQFERVSDLTRVDINTPEALEEAFAAMRSRSQGFLQLFAVPKFGAPLSDDTMHDSYIGKGTSGGGHKRELLSELRSIPGFHVQEFLSEDFDGLYDYFKHEARDGSLNRKQVEDGLRKQGIRGPQALFDSIFDAFDSDKSGSVEFEELVVGLATIRKGSMKDRLQLAFQAFDKDGDGNLDIDELTSMVRIASDHRNGHRISWDQARRQAEDIMDVADDDRSGTLDFDEFSRAVHRSDIMLNMFWTDGA